MRTHIRIHGDNIVECERISDLIIEYLAPSKTHRYFSSLSCISIDLDFVYKNNSYKWSLELFPGFNKPTSNRWKSNILELLRQEGSFLDETPDAIITRVNDSTEKIVLAIEFCSALQAGNQAWQRSGRAYSTGRTKCSYMYIVDFIKYELDTKTRARKALRYPNPAVPYSYITYSKNNNNFVAQVSFRAEEFQPTFDRDLMGFDTSIFAEKEAAEYLIRKIIGLPTEKLEQIIIDKNFRMVKFLANKFKEKENFTSDEWAEIYDKKYDVIDFSLKTNRFKFKKKIAAKSIVGDVENFKTIVQKYSVGLASVDLPFGIIPTKNRNSFASDIIKLYQIKDKNLKKQLTNQSDLVVCMLKGFKPGGDDNRPDRGALPLIAMLAGENTEILTFIYGPILRSSLQIMDQDILQLAKQNGLWKSIIGLSSIIIIDATLKEDKTKQIVKVLNNGQNKRKLLRRSNKKSTMLVSNVPNQYLENDVDTVIHFLFKYVIPNCFEGMCNPPGGDWSGLSIIQKSCEYRWLSLPRVSADGKRPDHVIELFDLFPKPLILSIESKEKANDLETDVGTQLKGYLEYLFRFKPSTERTHGGEWKISNKILNFEDFECLSAGAYIDTGNIDSERIFTRTNCDILFGLLPKPSTNQWLITMLARDCKGEKVIDYITANICNCNAITINSEIEESLF